MKRLVAAPYTFWRLVSCHSIRAALATFVFFLADACFYDPVPGD
jgi:hypothetical protein